MFSLVLIALSLLTFQFGLQWVYSENPFQDGSWIEINLLDKSNNNEPVQNVWWNAVYDSTYDIDSIFLLTGTECERCIYQYSIFNDSISLYDTMPVFNTVSFTVAVFGRPGAVMINDTIYFGVHEDTEIFSYHIPSKTRRRIENLPTGEGTVCISTLNIINYIL